MERHPQTNNYISSHIILVSLNLFSEGQRANQDLSNHTLHHDQLRVNVVCYDDFEHLGSSHTAACSGKTCQQLCILSKVVCDQMKFATRGFRAKTTRIVCIYRSFMIASFRSIWLEGWKSERTENGRRMEKCEDRKIFNLSHFCLVGSGKVKGWKK